MDERNDSRQERGGPLPSFGLFIDEQCNIKVGLKLPLVNRYLRNYICIQMETEANSSSRVEYNWVCNPVTGQSDFSGQYGD